MKKQIKNINRSVQGSICQHDDFLSHVWHWPYREGQHQDGKNNQQRIWDFIQGF